MKTYRIHLIRHGLTQGNLDGVYIGHRDIPLCEAGREELLKLMKDCVYPDIPVLFSSPLKRALETGRLLYPAKDPLIINELIEYNFGEFEGRSAKDLKDDEEFSAWLSGGPTFAPPFGETNEHFGTRICEAFEKIVDGLFKTGISEAGIITHGGVIMGLMSRYALPERPMTDWLAKNGCGYSLLINPGLWSRIKKAEAVREIPIPKTKAD